MHYFTKQEYLPSLPLSVNAQSVFRESSLLTINILFFCTMLLLLRICLS